MREGGGGREGGEGENSREEFSTQIMVCISYPDNGMYFPQIMVCISCQNNVCS